MTENIIQQKTEGDERPSVYFQQEMDGDKTIYKNVRKAKIPNTADIAYCEIRITELQAELDAQREQVFKLEQQQDLYVTYEQTINQLQERNQILNDENKQLTLLLRSRTKELDLAKFKILEYESQLERLRDIEQDYNNTYDQLQVRDKELKELTEKYGQLELKHSQQKVLELENFDIKNKITNLQNDLNVYKDRNNKLEAERKRLADLQTEVSTTSKIEVFKSEVNISQVTTQQPPQDYAKFKTQLQEQSDLLNQMKNDIQEKDHRLGLLNHELTKLQETLSNKNEQISQLQSQLDSTDAKLKELESKAEQYKAKPTTIIKTVEKIVKVTPTDADEEKVRLTNELERANFEIERYKFELAQLQQKLETQEKIISDLSRDVRQIIQLNEEIELLKIDKANLINALNQKEQDQEFTLNLLNQKTLELQNLDKIKFNLTFAEDQIQTKQREIISLKRRIGDVENSNNQLKQLQPELRQAKNLIEELKSDNENLDQQIKQLKANLMDAEVVINQLKKLEQRIKALQNTNSSLRQEITQTLTESEQWRQKYNQGCSEITRLQRLLEVNQQRQQILNEQNKNFKNDFEIPDIKVDPLPIPQRLTKQIIQDESQITKLKNNLVAVELQLESVYRNKILEQQTYQSQIDEINSKYQLKKGESESWKQKYLKSEQENVKLMNINEKYSVLMQRYDSQEIIIQSLNEKLKQLTVELDKSRAEVFNLHLQLNQLDVLIKERDQFKQRADAYYLEIQNQYKQIPLLKAQILDLTRQLKLTEIPVIRVAQKTDAIEKLRQQNVELEQKIDDTLEDQIDELQQTNNVLRQELTKQIDINTQLIKDLSNADRKKQDILIELQLLQAIEIDYQQLKIAYLNKQKENDKIKIQSDQIEFKQRDLENAIHSSNQLGLEQKNEIQKLRERTNNQNEQVNELLIKLNSLQQLNNDYKFKLEMFPELQEKVNQQAKQIDDLKKSLQNSNEIRDELTAKCTLQQVKLQSLGPLQSKIESLQLILDERQRQLDLWQTKALELEDSKSKLNQEWRKKFDAVEIQLKNQKELDQLLKQQEHDINDLISQNNKFNIQNKELSIANQLLNKDVDQRDIEIKRLLAIETDFRKLNENLLIELQRIADLTDKLQIAQNQYDAAKRDQERLENKCAMMSSEIERLSIMVKNKNIEIEGNKAILHQNQSQIDQVQPIFVENKRLFDELNNVLKSNEELKIQSIQLQKQIDELKSTINNGSNYENQLKDDLDQLEQAFRHKENEISEIKQLLRQSENQVKDIKRDDQQWIDQQAEKEKLTNQLNYINELLNSKNAENEQLTKQNHVLQSKLLDNQKLDFEHLELALNTRDKVIEEWKGKFQRLQQDLQKVLEDKVELENRFSTVDLEIERWKRKANSNSAEIEMLRVTIDQLNDEIERLNKNTQDLLNENDSWRHKYGNLQQLIPQMVHHQPNPETQAYQVTPGNSFRIPPGTERNQGSFRNQPPPLDSRRSFRRATTIGLTKP
ncbi:unnamed protein product [Paramecium primaurelia]|uniref:Uncharacterized protein n=1 Tax=Paramecium primaurelia TaxID=5886 RepID=A0A8S1PKY4_PARPR|nr:unnamed protein product [Paramecium primaurelia]